MNITKRLTAIGCALSMLHGITAPVTAEPDTSYRQLQDYTIFNGSGNINWCGGKNLEVSNARIPVDSNVTCNGISSLRVNVTAASDQWSVRLVVRNWMSTDFSAYEKEGCLEFDVKGNAGNEKFRIGLADHTDEDVTSVSMDKYVTLTSEWQHVSVPLADLAVENPDVDFSDINLLYLLNDGTTDSQKFWITNIEITSDGLEPETPPIKMNQAGFLTNVRNTYGHYKLLE